MSVQFRLQDFFLPMSLFRYHQLLNRAQWWNTEKIEAWQIEQLKNLLNHAKRHVPYYRDLFLKSSFEPGSFRNLDDLKNLPILSKETVRKNPEAFLAENFQEYHPQKNRTSGSSGQPLQFWLDRQTNALEFAYYWRYWGWFGYKLGSAFAEFSTSYFMHHKNKQDHDYAYRRAPRRLLLNSLSLYPERTAIFIDLMKKYRVRFLKGLPSVLYYFCLQIKNQSLDVPPLTAVFSTGEVLYPHQRKLIQNTLQGRVVDSYGQMERVVAICECPEGRYHINTDYGLLELEPSVDNPNQFRMIGTGLHNYSMPLIRYDLGDWASSTNINQRCPCGRGFPWVERIEGRSEDVVITPSGKIISTLYLVFYEQDGIDQGQIIQNRPDHLVIRLVNNKNLNEKRVEQLGELIKAHVGNDMTFSFDFCRSEDLFQMGSKNKVIQSQITSSFSQ